MKENIRIRTGVYGVVIQGGRLLVIKQKRGPHENKFDLPGGGIEPGESIEEALKREMLEETAIQFGSMHLFGNFVEITGLLQRICLVYHIKDISYLADSTPELTYHWIELEKLISQPITPLLKHVLG